MCVRARVCVCVCACMCTRVCVHVCERQELLEWTVRLMEYLLSVDHALSSLSLA